MHAGKTSQQQERQMQTRLASAADEVVKLLTEAKEQGHLVILRTSPPSHVDVRTPLLMALNWLFNLSPAEGRALIELMQYGQVSREALHVAMSPDGTAVSNIKTIDVVVSRMRRKLASHGIKIVTVWGLGFKLAEGARNRIHQQLVGQGLIPEPDGAEHTDRPHPE
jgi:hypothetical protein